MLEARDATPAENEFIKDNIDCKNTRIYFTKIDGFVGGSATWGNNIIIAEKLGYSDMTLDEALKTNNDTVKKTNLAIIEHEATHLKENHALQEIITMNTISCTLAGGTYITLRKYFKPLEKNAPVSRYSERFGAKVFGGAALSFPISLVTLLALKKLNHYQEYRADNGVSPENHEALIAYLKRSPHNAIDSHTHPSVSKRAARFRQQTHAKQS
jgi:hypothetical protein